MLIKDELINFSFLEILIHELAKDIYESQGSHLPPMFIIVVVNFSIFIKEEKKIQSMSESMLYKLFCLSLLSSITWISRNQVSKISRSISVIKSETTMHTRVCMCVNKSISIKPP